MPRHLSTLAFMWYYTLNGDQAGPVSEAELRLLLERELPESTLVWKSGMAEWASYKTIDSFSDIHATETQGASENLGFPQATENIYRTQHDPEPFGALTCFSQSWKLLAAKFGDIFLVCIIYLVCLVVSGSVVGVIQNQLDDSYLESVVQLPEREQLTIAKPSTSESILEATEELSIEESLEYKSDETPQVQEDQQTEQFSPEFFKEMFEEEWKGNDNFNSPFASTLGAILDQIIGAYLSVGLTVTLLAILRGGKFNISQFFKQPIAKAFKVFIATIVYGILVCIGLIFLVIPGIYLAVRLIFFSTAIADKNLGIIESLQYSMDITKGKFFSLLGLWFLNFFAIIAGFLCFLLGLIWAVPLTIITWLVAYETLRLNILKKD